MFSHKIDEHTELRLIERQHVAEFFRLIDSNREHWRRWHPLLRDALRSPAEVEQFIAMWLQHFANNRGFCAGVWFDGGLCGMIYHVTVDWVNRWVALSYWLDEAHQGRGIMTASCRAFILHAFTAWKMNRVTIQCATENVRSRAIPERLGFRLEGILRETECLHDHYVDHAFYALLQSDYTAKNPRNGEESLF